MDLPMLKIHKRITGWFIPARHYVRYFLHGVALQRGQVLVYEEKYWYDRNADKPHAKKYRIDTLNGSIVIEFNIAVDSCREKNWIWMYASGEFNAWNHASANYWHRRIGYYIPGTNNNNAVLTQEQINGILTILVECAKQGADGMYRFKDGDCTIID